MSTDVARPPTGHGRRLLVGLVVAILLIVSAPQPAHAADFVGGSATADASTFALAMKQGANSLGLAWGAASTSYREGYASAAAKPLDLQLVRLLLGQPSQCPGSTDPVPIPDSALPANYETNSIAPTAGTVVEGDSDFPGFYGAPSPGKVGHGRALAPVEPRAIASTTTPTIDLGILSIVNPSTSSESSLQGHVRFATATARADQLTFLGGALVLDRPTWTATVRSGDVTTHEGSFTVAGGALFGSPRTADEALGDLTGAAEWIRLLLGYVGLSLELPTVKIEGDLVHVSPLQLQIVDSPLAKDIVAPLMDTRFGGQPSFSEQLSQGLEDWAAKSCDGKRYRQILEIMVGLLRGVGGIGLPIGGVTVATDATPPPAFQNLTTAPMGPLSPDTYEVAASEETFADDRGSAGYSSSGGYDAGEVDPTDAGTEAPPGTDDAATADDDTIEFAAPIASRTRTVDGVTGGAGVVISALMIVAIGAAIVSERVMKARRLRRLDP